MIPVWSKHEWESLPSLQLDSKYSLIIGIQDPSQNTWWAELYYRQSFHNLSGMSPVIFTAKSLEDAKAKAPKLFSKELLKIAYLMSGEEHPMSTIDNTLMRRALAKNFKQFHDVMPTVTKVEILVALGNDERQIGALFQNQASLNDDGFIEYHVTEGKSRD